VKLAEPLRDSGFLIQSKEHYELYETPHSKIAKYLDGNIEAIQAAAVKDYFLIQHCKADLDES
jgi:hypothetical protein